MTTVSEPAGHVALVGDSIFDNAAYTRGEPDVVGHLQALLPATWQATLLAVDGAMVKDVSRQLAALPASVTHVVMSVGGNDAIMNSDLLNTPSRGSAETLLLFSQRLDPFESAYRETMAQISGTSRRAAVCTIYNGALEPGQARLARVALMTFNDVILRAAFEHNVDVIDLRLVCTDREDYANAIEPSGRGALKIAKAVARAVMLTEPHHTSRIFR
jgi:hypothetical protein